MPNRVLLIAFHFPPIKASSGLERTLALVRHLPARGWEPLVLSAHPRAYPATSDERLDLIPPGTVVERCFALDASKHLSIGGRYPAWFTLPDKWQSWAVGAIPKGLAMIRRYQPKIIWSTYPITTAHYIGYALHRLTGIPWVADFRDPMVEYDCRRDVWSPGWPALRKLRLAAEERAARHASALAFCTEGARRICQERYPDVPNTHWRVISNGFDETAFSAAELAKPIRTAECREIVLLHSGTIYPTLDRDPSHFFRGLRHYLDNRPAGLRPLRVMLRASGVESHYRQLIEELQLTECVRFEPAITYEAALKEMMEADGVIVFQGYTSNPAIPAKIYEYFRARRPILALVDAAGDTARLLDAEGIGIQAPLDDEQQIAEALETFVSNIEQGRSKVLAESRIAHFERSRSVEQFAVLFDEILGQA